MYIQLYTYIATLIAKIYYNSKNMRALISVYIYIYKYIHIAHYVLEGKVGCKIFKDSP